MSGNAPRHKRVNPVLLCALFLGALPFLQTFHFDFIFDDIMLIVDNPAIQHWRNVPDYFKGGMFGHLDGAQSFNFYRPVFLLWLRLNHAAFWVASGWWHLAAVAAHLVGVYLVFKVVQQLSTESIAGWTALFFAVHPAHVEAITWLSSASEILFTAVLLACLLCYVKLRESDGHRWLVLLGLHFAVALLIKETSLTFLLILPVFERCLPGDFKWKTFLKTFLFLASISVGYLVLRHFALGELASVDHSRPFSRLVFTWPALITFYVIKLLWPFHFSFIYLLPWVDSWTNIRFLLPLLAIVALVAATIVAGRYVRLMWLAGAIFLFPLLPQLIAIWVYNEYDLVHDRYLYFPVLGFCLLLALGLERFSKSRPRLGPFLGAALVIIYSIACFALAPISRNNETVFLRAVEVAPQNPLAWNLLGDVYAKRNDHPRAIKVLLRAYELRPDYWYTNFALGKSYFQTGDHANAEAYFLRARNLDRGFDPNSIALQNMLLGLSQLRLNKLQDAEESLRLALKASPALSNQHFALGQILEAQGRYAEARAEYVLEMELRKSARDARTAIERIDRKIAAPAPRR